MPDIQVVASHTPNPNAMKFVVDRKVIASGSVTWNSAAAATTDWGKRILGLKGVVAVFALNDFVTVTKVPSSDWNDITDGVRAALRDGLR